MESNGMEGMCMDKEPSALAALARADEELDAWVLALRRELHRRPEVAGEEGETRAALLRWLAELGLEAGPCGEGFGVVALIRGALPGPTLALRADMDALPVEEPTGEAFRSERPGAMHACGHDAHMAIQLGVARLLRHHRERMRGNIKLLFEPSEETRGGIRGMMTAGCLENPHVDAALALHVSPKRPCGQAEIHGGLVSGASEDVRIIVRGRAGHGAYPEQAVDAVVLAAHVITALQAVISREVSPLDSAVLSLGCIRGGTAENVICGEVEVRGTLRALELRTIERLKRRIAEVTAGVCSALGGVGEVAYHDGYPSIHNNFELASRAQEAARAALGEEAVRSDGVPSLGVDSFSFLSARLPGVYWAMGCGVGPPLHASGFRVDEACLPLAVRAQACIAWELLAGLAKNL